MKKDATTFPRFLFFGCLLKWLYNGNLERCTREQREIELIRRVVRPEVKGCYRNAHLLTLLFPDRVRYVEGKTHTVIPIDHAFNRVGDKYIDITFEFALEF